MKKPMALLALALLTAGCMGTSGNEVLEGSPDWGEQRASVRSFLSSEGQGATSKDAAVATHFLRAGGASPNAGARASVHQDSWSVAAPSVYDANRVQSQQHYQQRLAEQHRSVQATTSASAPRTQARITSGPIRPLASENSSRNCSPVRGHMRGNSWVKPHMRCR